MNYKKLENEIVKALGNLKVIRTSDRLKAQAIIDAIRPLIEEEELLAFTTDFYAVKKEFYDSN